MFRKALLSPGSKRVLKGWVLREGTLEGRF